MTANAPDIDTVIAGFDRATQPQGVPQPPRINTGVGADQEARTVLVTANATVTPPHVLAVLEAVVLARVRL